MSFRIADSVPVQVATFVCRKILLNEWKSGEKLPGAHELAALLEVNLPNAVKAVEYLAAKGLMDGQGRVHEKAGSAALALMREHFIGNEVPAFSEKMRLLGLTVADLKDALENQPTK